MATYKVIQDIESEDKFIGPLTLKQFIFAGAGVFFGYLSFFFAARGIYFMLAILIPPMLLGFFLAIPWSKEQSTEVWVLAKLRFRLKPKIRLWNQSGLEQLVTITAPKKIEKQLTNGLDQIEVQSRLKALAETIDTRGWATKHATLNTAYASNIPSTDERLINPANVPQQVPEVDTSAYNDPLDDDNTVSTHFQQMIQASSQNHKQQSLDRMDRARRGEPLDQPAQAAIQFTPPAESYGQLDEAGLAQQLRNERQARDAVNHHMRTFTTTPQLQTTAAPPQSQPVEPALPAEQPQAEMTRQTNPVIMDLAQNNDLNIETLARQAKKNDLGDGEVVISLR